MPGYKREREVQKGARTTAVLLCSAGLIAALGYFTFELWSFAHGQRGHLRGALIFLAAAGFAMGLLFPRSSAAKALIAVALAVSTLGAIDLVLHAPGSSIFGLNPRFLNDFNIHLDAAAKLYKEGSSPYNPAINNFPLPTFSIFWAASGLGRWGREASGLALTALNLVAAFFLIVVSMRLAGVAPRAPEQNGRAWVPAAVVWFLILNTQAWPNVMMGQTPLLAACLILSGLWLSKRCDTRYEILSGSLVALGILFKPNLAPFLLYFAAAWINKGNSHHHARILASCAFSSILFVFISILVPGGISLGSYASFGRHIPLALEHLKAPHNISLVAALDPLFPTMPRKLMSGLLIVTSGALLFTLNRSRRGNLHWPVWLVVPLLVSPVTWTIYAVLLLPAQLLLARQFGSEDQVVNSVLLVLSAGMLYIAHTLPGLAALMLTLYLTVRVNVPVGALPGETMIRSETARLADLNRSAAVGLRSALP